jgi:hypothetical protein
LAMPFEFAEVQSGLPMVVSELGLAACSELP